MTPDLLITAKAKGTDRQYRYWISHQTSCISGNFSEWVDGVGRCEAAHHRTAANAGVGMKPPYSCIPLTRAEHAWQHQAGASELGDRDWWDAQVVKYLKRWIES